MMRKLLVATLFLAVAGFIAFNELQRRWQQPLTVPEEGFALTVAPGESLRSVVQKLHAERILPHPDLAVLYGRWTGLDQQVKQGEYQLAGISSIESLLSLLKSGKVIQYQVTLPEGITLATALQILAQQDALEHVLDGPADERILALVAPRSVAEGLFFPDSYRFTRGTSDWQLLRRAHRAMLAVLDEEWQGRAEDLPYESVYEALIMASIVERETGTPDERQQIAGVFVRRMQRGMRLQTDPTIIYGLGSDFDGDLKRRHLADAENPYNTYRHSGLPPSPIALPGRAAIHAALHPADGDALYFVARGDGGHQFSATLAEHEAAVRKYQLQRRQDYRSSPGKQ